MLEKVEEPQVMRDNALQMVQCKVLKVLEIMGARKYDDQDLQEDIAFVTEKLHTNVQDLRSV
jgi:V-type H+-transporting ATPase subunit H